MSGQRRYESREDAELLAADAEAREWEREAPVEPDPPFPEWPGGRLHPWSSDGPV